MFNSTNGHYTQRFMGHFQRFIQQFQLFGMDSKLLVTVSGGIDSMALLFALNQLKSYGYSNQLRVLHIHHGTRKEQDDEALLVQNYCHHLGVEFIEQKLSDLNPNRNFEYHARLKRYDAFYDVAKDDELIVLAHHIDDSFEWTILQSLRSSSIEGLIGIPVKNNRVVRPFMCVTKAQIKNFVKYYDLPFIEDPTNDQIKYERNYIRGEVIPTFQLRYHQYLKHYVHRHNEIARRLGVHLILKDRSDFQLNFGENSVLIYNLTQNFDPSGVSHLVLRAMKYLNPNQRGSLTLQLKKIEQALSNHKLGPLNLTGNFKAYLDYNLILITSNKERDLKLRYREFKTFSYDEFTNYIHDFVLKEKYHLDFPFIVLVNNSKLDDRKFRISFNTDNLNKFIDSETVYYPALKLLRVWSKKSYRHKVLRLNFLTSV